MVEPINLTKIFGVLGTFGMPVLVVLIVFLFAYLEKRRKYHLAEMMVERGRELPEFIFEKKDQMDSSVKLLKYGLIFLALGIGLAIFGWVEGNIDILAISSAPALLGVAYLIVSFVVKKKEDKAAELAERKEAEAQERELGN